MRSRLTSVVGIALCLASPLAAANPVVIETAPGLFAGGASDLHGLGADAYFVGVTSSGGARLWRSDGTAPGTVMLKAFPPTNFAASIDVIGSGGSHMFFIGDDGALWRTDGTVLGTLSLLSIASMSQHVLGRATLPNGKTLFTLQKGVLGGFATAGWLVKTDGTPSGTTAESFLATRGQLHALGSFAYYAQAGALHRTDGTTHGSFYAPAPGWVEDLEVCGNYLYFTTSATKVGLFRTDGTLGGTVDLTPAGTFQATLAGCVGSKLVFNGYRSATGNEPWVTDGTAAGTTLLKDIVAGPSPSWNAGNVALSSMQTSSAFYFVVDENVAKPELWMTDGTSTGTTKVFTPSSGRPQPLAAVGDKMLFDADLGTRLATGTTSTVLAFPSTMGRPTWPATAAGTRIFSEAESFVPSGSGDELWVFDTAQPIADAGVVAPVDAGVLGPTDGGTLDAGTRDSGTRDAGSKSDAGAAKRDAGDNALPTNEHDAGDDDQTNATTTTSPNDPTADGCSLVGHARAGAFAWGLLLAAGLVARRRSRDN